MKRLFLTTSVIALFAIGFTASGDSEEVRYDDYGVEYHKKTIYCAICGDPYTYWESKDGGCSIGKPSDSMAGGKYYCSTKCISKMK